MEHNGRHRLDILCREVEHKENIREWGKEFCTRESDAPAFNIDIMYNEWQEAMHNAAWDSIGEVKSGIGRKKG